MHGEVTDAVCPRSTQCSVVNGGATEYTVHFGASIYDALRVVRKAREMHTVLLALQLFGMFALLAIIDLERIVVACHDCKLSGVIKVERGHRSPRVAGFEFLSSRQNGTPINRGLIGLTLAGRKVDMTSLTFCVGAPGGGPGGLGAADPVAMLVM